MRSCSCRSFAAFVSPDAEVRISPEHDQLEWLPPDAARARMSWPRMRREIDDVMGLLGTGGAGVLEDMLRLV